VVKCVRHMNYPYLRTNHISVDVAALDGGHWLLTPRVNASVGSRNKMVLWLEKRE
jgi:hypothetical protein